MSEAGTIKPTAAKNLRPNDAITIRARRVALTKIVPLGSGYVELIWGGGGEDRCVVAGDELIGRVDG